MSDYPKKLVHPAYSPGTSGRQAATDQHGELEQVKAGTPCRFPPVLAATKDEEDQYRAKGYLGEGEAPPAVAGYAEYPKMLVHPDHVPETPPEVVAFREHEGGPLLQRTLPGKPAVLPPVTVHSREEEAAWNVKGYQMPRLPDPLAVERAHASPYDPDRETSEYPRWENGVLVNDPALNSSGRQEYPKYIGDVLVQNADEEAAILGSGFTASRIEALIVARREASAEDDADEVVRIEQLLAENGIALEDKPHGTIWRRLEAEPPSPPAAGEQDGAPTPAAEERAKLIAEATARGIEVNKHWSTQRIADALKQAAA